MSSFPEWYHTTHATPCRSGPERPDDALCQDHGLMIAPADETVWPNLMHTKRCLAAAMICAIENERDYDLTRDLDFRIAMQDNHALTLADSYLLDGTKTCEC